MDRRSQLDLNIMGCLVSNVCVHVMLDVLCLCMGFQNHNIGHPYDLGNRWCRSTKIFSPSLVPFLVSVHYIHCYLHFLPLHPRPLLGQVKAFLFLSYLYVKWASVLALVVLLHAMPSNSLVVLLQIGWSVRFNSLQHTFFVPNQMCIYNITLSLSFLLLSAAIFNQKKQTDLDTIPIPVIL